MKLLPPVSIRPIARAVLVLGVTLPAGCGPGGPLPFVLNTEGRDPQGIALTQAEAITETLQDLFGTPDEPKVPERVELDGSLLSQAAGPMGLDADGKQRGLYRRRCATCHGLSGDGAGPAAGALNPYPRDFRNGIFKYTSTAAGAEPVREDLRGTLLRGIPGTAMPSFVRLPPREIDALVEYVRYLSIRGQTELYLLELVIDEDEYLPLEARLVMEEGLIPTVEMWADAARMVVSPPPRPPVDTPRLLAASIARGRELYADKDAQCVKCHGPEGEGDGEETELYDDWNERKKGVTPRQADELARLFELPIRRLRPRNFKRGAYRGGHAPEELYWRIHVGIKGTPMPAAGPAPGAKGVLTPEQIWHVVNYIRRLGR